MKHAPYEENGLLATDVILLWMTWNN